MIVTCQQMQDAEAQLFATGVEAEPVMDIAGQGCAAVIRKVFAIPGRAILFCGKGNNGGDALVVGRILRENGWHVEVRFSHPANQISELAHKKLHEFSHTADIGSRGGGPLVLVDGLLGIGAKGALRGEVGSLATQLNEIRRSDWGVAFAIDIPSGVDGDTGEVYQGAVMADHTLSICAAKKGILMDCAINHVGRIHSVAVPEIPIPEGDENLRLLCPETLRPRLLRRDFNTHKGMAGRVAIVAGSTGLTGAPVLTALGALNAGAGLISLFVPESIYTIVASQAPVEAMVRPFSAFSEVLSATENADVFAVGPGLGDVPNQDILDWIEVEERPVVVDADALNWLAATPNRLQSMPSGKRLLTPHPGELNRLMAQSETIDRDCDRFAMTENLAEQWGVSLLHKGARSIICSSDQPTEINTSGTPNMASGGMGDVLTGMCAAFIGQGIGIHDAGCLGSWLLGRAAELSTPTVSATKVADGIGMALRELRA